MSERDALAKAVKGFPVRPDERPQTIGPAPNRQTSQFPEDPQWEELLFDYVKTFEGIEVGHSHISGDGGSLAFFLPQYSHLHGVQTQFLVDNEFAHIHEHPSSSLHAVLPEEIGQLVFEKSGVNSTHWQNWATSAAPTIYYTVPETSKKPSS